MSLQALTGELYELFKNKDHEQCKGVMSPIKVELIKHGLLVPLEHNTQTKEQLNDLKIAERILEIGALASLLTNDYEGFENYFSQLRPFYSNLKLHTKLEVNTDTTKIISLNLLYLLAQGLVSRFYMELEAIYNSKQYDIEKDSYLLFPIYLERNLMEGNYNKIWKLLNESDNQLPCIEYKHFHETLISALRLEIAKSIQTTYESLPVRNCKSLLYLPQEQSDYVFEQYCKEHLEAEDWNFKDGVIYFTTSNLELNVYEPLNVVQSLVGFAEQMESII